MLPTPINEFKRRQCKPILMLSVPFPQLFQYFKNHTKLCCKQVNSGKRAGKDCCLLGHDAMYQHLGRPYCVHVQGTLLPGDRSSVFLRNICTNLLNQTEVRKPESGNDKIGLHLLRQILTKKVHVAIKLTHNGDVRGTRWRSWLRHCATSRKVAGSIPGGVIGIFH